MIGITISLPESRVTAVAFAKSEWFP